MANPTTNFGWVMPTATDLVTDLPADFAVFGQGVDTSMAYLLGGTTGQILSKTSATNMAFTWISNDQGDITGVTASTGLSGGGTSGTVSLSIDSTVATLTGTQTLTNKTLTSPALTTPTISTLTTNGDVLYGTGSGALSRLGIGSSAQVLTVSGGGIPSWATPVGGGGWTLINSGGTALGAGTTTVSSIPGTYQELRVWVVGFTPSDMDLVYQMRINGDTTSKYIIIGSYTSAVTNLSSNGTSWQLNINGLSNDADAAKNFNEISLPNYASSTAYKTGQSLNFYKSAASGVATNWGLFQSNLTYLSATAITSLSFKTDGTGFSAGTIYVYGVK